MDSDFSKRSVDSLQRIYAIIVALAIAQAINAIFINKGELASWQDMHKHIFQFVSFVCIIVPFFHGMNRHLDKCYLDKKNDMKEGALLFDFIVFFVESMLLFAFAGTLKSPSLNCYIVLLVLLAFDTLWAFVSHFIHYSNEKKGPIQWAIINLVTMVLMILIWYTSYFKDETKPLLMTILVLLRSIFDYTLCWEFYFPKYTRALPPTNGMQ